MASMLGAPRPRAARSSNVRIARASSSRAAATPSVSATTRQNGIAGGSTAVKRSRVLALGAAGERDEKHVGRASVQHHPLPVREVAEVGLPGRRDARLLALVGEVHGRGLGGPRAERDDEPRLRQRQGRALDVEAGRPRPDAGIHARRHDGKRHEPVDGDQAIAMPRLAGDEYRVVVSGAGHPRRQGRRGPAGHGAHPMAAADRPVDRPQDVVMMPTRGEEQHARARRQFPLGKRVRRHRARGESRRLVQMRPQQRRRVGPARCHHDQRSVEAGAKALEPAVVDRRLDGLCGLAHARRVHRRRRVAAGREAERSDASINALTTGTPRPVTGFQPGPA